MPCFVHTALDTLILVIHKVFRGIERLRSFQIVVLICVLINMHGQDCPRPSAHAIPYFYYLAEYKQLTLYWSLFPTKC